MNTKYFLRKLLLFAFIFACLDLLSGFIFRYLAKNAKGGDTARNEYIANKMDAPILIFGSSRAVHHYVPQYFRNHFGLDCYNCGQDGMGIILFYARYKMITERYIPKIIIYDVLSGFDLEKGDNYSYLGWLKPYYEKQGVDSIFWNIAPNERYKMYSQMYRYNGKILQMLADNILIMREETDGYRPAYGTMDYEPSRLSDSVSVQLDSVKLYYWEKFIQECNEKGTKLIFTLSPFYGGSNAVDTTYSAIYDLSKKYNIPVINYFNDTDIVNQKDYFMDSFHMNYQGAEVFSKKISEELYSIILHNNIK